MDGYGFCCCVLNGFCDFMWFFVFSFLLAFLGLCCVGVSAVLVFAEGASVACPADLDASIFAFNYFYWSYYDGFTRGIATGICPVKAWNRNWNN